MVIRIFAGALIFVGALYLACIIREAIIEKREREQQKGKDK